MPEPSYTVHRPGSEVSICGTDLKGIVTQVLLDGVLPTVSYKVHWWIDGDLKEHWLQDFQVRSTEDSLTTTFGFHKP